MNFSCRKLSGKPAIHTAIIGKWHLGHADPEYSPETTQV